MKSIVKLRATVIGTPIAQKTYGVEKILEVNLKYTRLSGTEDYIILNYSSGLGVDLNDGDFIDLTGELRSICYKDIESGKKRTKVYVFAEEIKPAEGVEPVNEVTITEGVLIKDPYRRTSYTDNLVDVTDILLRIPRGTNKTSVIPCSVWNNNARLIAKYKKGDIVSLVGRIQSRQSKKSGIIFSEISVSAIDVSEVADNSEVSESENADA